MSPESKLEAREQLMLIMKRLEAATSRLEDMATSGGVEGVQTNGTKAPASSAAIAAGSSAPKAAEPPKPPVEAVPEMIEDFDQFISKSVQNFVKHSNELGGPVAEQVRTDFLL